MRWVPISTLTPCRASRRTLIGSSEMTMRIRPAALRQRLKEPSDQSLRIVVVGGAETGVEVAGEIKSAWPRGEVTMISRSRCGNFRGNRERTRKISTAGIGTWYSLNDSS
jgi:hypothetical protein